MSLEGPMATGVISILANPEAMQAAFVALFPICLFIESPAIDMLSIGTSFVRGPKSYISVVRYCLAWLALATGLHVAFAATPLFSWITRDMLQFKPEIIARIWFPAWFFLTWTLCVGWRRLHQGILIQRGHTRPIMFATVARVLAIVVAGYWAFWYGKISGVTAVSIAINFSVLVEGSVVYAICRPYVRSFGFSKEDDRVIPWQELLHFHLPLILSTMLAFATGPLVSSAMQRLAEHERNMAAWGIAMNIVWMQKAATFALPEVIIRSYDTISHRILRVFSIKVGVWCALAGIFICATKLDQMLFIQVMHRSPATAETAHALLWLCSPLPLATAIANYYRGLLTARRATHVRAVSVVLSLVCMVVTLGAGVTFRWGGALTAALGLASSQLCEMVYLWWAWNRLAQNALQLGAIQTEDS